MTIIDEWDDPHLFKPLFKDLSTWKSWRVVFKARYVIPMTDEESALFTTLSGWQTPPRHPVRESWLIVSRRGGKSFMEALDAAHLACFVDYRPYLGPGEIGVVMIIATDRRQARVIMRYLAAILNSVPMLRAMILKQDSEAIELNNGITIEIVTASYRTIRGYTIVAAICDEISFWRSEESANPAGEILDALRPAMATIPTAKLVCCGTPYRRSGVLHDAWKRHYGKQDADVLVIQADTRTMNPTVPQSVIERAMELDPVSASAEYLAQFRSDVGSFLDADLIERAIEAGRRERPPLKDVSYFDFADPSGGVHDPFTVAIGHREGERLVLDVCRGVKPPFDPSQVVAEFAALLKAYRCFSVVGDRYAGEWVVEAFRKAGIHYRHSDLTKSELYLECLPLFAQGAVDLLDAPPLQMQLQQLERRTSRSGRDSVDHPPGGHDDHANACCGVLALLAAQSRQVAYMIPVIEDWSYGTSDDDEW